MSVAPPGWYPDPTEPSRQRYWDGTTWTERVTQPASIAPPAFGLNGVPPQRTNGLAVASFVLSLLFLCGVGSVLGVVFGHVSLGQIKREQQRGRGLAIAGTILGYLGAAGMVLFFVSLTSDSPKDKAGVTADSPQVVTSNTDATTGSLTLSEGNGAPAEGQPFAVAGFTKHEALGHTWVSVGVVLTGLSGGSQKLIITLLDGAGTPLATTTEYIGSDRDGGEVLVSSSFTDDTPTVASVRVDLINASSFIDKTPFPVTVLSQGFDGNFWTVKGTAINDGSANFDYGTINCVAFRAGVPIAGTSTGTAAMIPGAPIAFDSSETFDPQADEVRCQGEAS